MEQTPPELRQSLIPKPKRGRKNATDSESIINEICNFGPIIVRARDIYDDYTLLLKNDITINFNHADWSTHNDNFITLYQKTANDWILTDVCVDDITTVTVTLK